MSLRHGSFAIDVPDDWSDHSQLMFVAPAPELKGPALNKVEPSSEAISVRFVVDGGTAQEALAAQERELSQLAIDYRRVSEGPFKTRLGEGWHYVQRFEIDGKPARQILVACPVGRVMIMASASTTEAHFEASRERLFTILASMRVGG